MFQNIVWPEGCNSSYVIYPIGRLIEMVPYAAIGIFICHYNILNRLQSKKYGIILSSITLIHIFLNYNAFIDPSGYGYAGIYKIVIGTLSLLLFYYLPFEILPSIIQKIIIEISKYTMGIYFIHRMIGTIVYNSKLCSYLRMRKGSIHDCIIIFIISLIISWIFNKIPLKCIKASIS